jgi:hypothetical protein
MSALGPVASLCVAHRNVRFRGIVLQNSANARSAPQNGQYPNPNAQFLDSKFHIQGLI